ncbi:ATP-binding cassette domain-containing protein [Micromonospora chalcea]|uniref:ATP-binding cassette domain-containing protein n=1 Tax=Micromonospora sp. B006 TaxID=2201999 RepID=UPI000E3057E4|nr:ATP-binding cassette domain-containing protein [Micromonospora sp. B006]
MTTTTSPMVEATGLRKAYRKQVVLDGIDLRVPRATVFALLGPNGAGKTTTVQILSTLIRPDGGTVRVAGHDLAAEPDRVRAVIGVTGQFSAVDALLTGAENLRLMTDLRHLGRIEGRRVVDDLLARFDLADAADKPVAAYSGGMKRRLDLAMTLVGRPRLIFLDEPTAGLDPRSRRAMWQVVRELVAEGTTVFLTTQYLEEADHLADQVALLDGGRLVAEGSPAELKRLVPGGHVRLHFTDPAQLAAAAGLFPAATRHDDDFTLRVPGDGGVSGVKALLDRLDAAGVAVESMSLHTPDLDDVFLALTGHRTEEKVTA